MKNEIKSRQKHERRNSRENAEITPNSAVYDFQPTTRKSWDDLKELCCSCFFAGLFQPSPSCILHSPWKDCTAVAGKEGITRRENQAVVVPLAVWCCWDLHFGGGNEQLSLGFQFRSLEACKKKKDVDKFSLNVPIVCMACWTAPELIDAVVWVFFLIQNTCSFFLILCF